MATTNGQDRDPRGEEYEILKVLQADLSHPPTDDEPALLTPDERRRHAAQTLYEYERAAVSQAVAMTYACQLAGLTENECEVIADQAEIDAYKVLGFPDEDAAVEAVDPPQ